MGTECAETFFPFFLKGIPLKKNFFNCDKIYIKFAGLTTLSAQSSDAKYIHIVVQPSPPPSRRSPFILRN